MASLCRLLPRASDVHPMSAPLVASRRTCGAVPNLIPASSGSGVLARLTTATLPLSVPKPDADQEPTRERPECARDGAAAPSSGHPAGVKSQAKTVFQNTSGSGMIAGHEHLIPGS